MVTALCWKDPDLSVQVQRHGDRTRAGNLQEALAHLLSLVREVAPLGLRPVTKAWVAENTIALQVNLRRVT